MTFPTHFLKFPVFALRELTYYEKLNSQTSSSRCVENLLTSRALLFQEYRLFFFFYKKQIILANLGILNFVLANLVSNYPQIVFISVHKIIVPNETCTFIVLRYSVSLILGQI